LKKLQLWDDNATFEDPLTIAKGRERYEPQWVLLLFTTPRRADISQYGLQTAFSEIERLHHEVISSGNPIVMDLKTRYVVKGINKEQTIESKINIFHDNGKITKVEDKWDGKLPESAFKDVGSPGQRGCYTCC
jgi:hypothetical protein